MGLSTALWNEMDRIDDLLDQLRSAGLPFEQISRLDDANNIMLEVERDVPSDTPTEHKAKLERVLELGGHSRPLARLVERLIDRVDAIDGEWIADLRAAHAHCQTLQSFEGDDTPARLVHSVLTGVTAKRLVS